MDFTFTTEQDLLRTQIRDFLRSELTEEQVYENLRLMGSGVYTRELMRKMGGKGWLGIDWPKEYGGQGKTAIESLIVQDELTYGRGPAAGIGVSAVGPMILRLGSEEQKNEFVPKIARGEIEFTFGYSEPEAGSDLAAVQTYAIENADHYVITGQKMFNTTAHYADYHWLLARTNTSQQKHKGLSIFIVDLKSPGISITPTWCISGARSNEVFYDNVIVPKKNLVGEKDRGFYHLMEALNRERLMYGTGDIQRNLEELTDLVKKARRNQHDLETNVLSRHKLAEMTIELEVARLFAYRTASLFAQGSDATVQASIFWVFSNELRQRLANVGMQILGLYGQLAKGSKWLLVGGHVELYYRMSVHLTIGAGTSEMQRNIIANRGLLLPR